MTFEEVRALLQRIAPEEIQEEWDRSGPQMGRMNRPVSRVLVALEVSRGAAEAAVRGEYDLLLTHHPLLFSPLSELTDRTARGEKILALAEHGICVYSMHTSYDSARGGMADRAAQLLGLEGARPMVPRPEDPGCGLGRIGRLPAEKTLQQLIADVRRIYGPAAQIGLYGGDADRQMRIRTVALCPGSGMSEAGEAARLGADVYLTGDVKYHDGTDAAENGLPVLCVDHFSMESGFAPDVAPRLQKLAPELSVDVWEERNPLTGF